AAAAVQVARLSSETESSSQTNNCAHLRQQCLIDTNGCEQSWRSMEDTCIVPELALPSGLVSQSNVTGGLQRKDDPSLKAERKDDCVAAVAACQESQHCTLLHESFKKACGKGTAQCHTLSGRLLCVALRQSLRETVLWGCQCASPFEGDCIQIWKSLFEDICIQDTQIDQNPTFSQDNEDGLKEDFASGFKQMQSCLEVTEACVGDVVCNAQLALYLKACSANGNLCDVKHCQAAIRFFYQNMPFNTAQMLAFCDCAQSDIPCQQSKETLHSKPCALNIIPPPTCLSVIHACRNDELCRTYYRTFQSECWPRVIGKCHEDETCMSTLGKQDLTCSGSESCKAAYLGTFGTVLQVPCACRSITQNEEPLCMTFQHMLHSRSCFRELVYVVLCMIATCGILFLVMLKLRIVILASNLLLILGLKVTALLIVVFLQVPKQE
ncbi:GDNF family receptor alpha-like, partial [Microtus ochrogaster]